MTKVPTSITPDIDAVIHARIEAIARATEARKHVQEKRPFVTISREYGCEGYGVAQAIERFLSPVGLGAEFPWMTFDKEILSRIAEESGHYPGLVNLVAEERLSMIGHVIIDLLSRLPDEYEIYQKMAKSIAVLAEKGNAIIIGRGSAYITRDIKRGVHIRLVAPFDFRAQRIAEIHSLSRVEAERQVRKMEREREAFVQKFIVRSAADPYLYHFIFNNSLCTAEEMAQTTISFMRVRKWI